MRKVFFAVMLCMGCLVVSSCGSSSPKDEVLSKMEEFVDWYEDNAKNVKDIMSLKELMEKCESESKKIDELIEKAKEEGCDLEGDKDFQKKTKELEKRMNEITEKLTEKVYGASIGEMQDNLNSISEEDLSVDESFSIEDLAEDLSEDEGEEF